MEFAEHLTTLLSEGRAFSAAARRAGWDAPVPTCPGWSVRDLTVHLGGVHRWVTTIVGESRAEPPGRDERAALGRGPDGAALPDAGLPDWFDEGLEALADTLARAEPGLSCWTLFAGRPGREFWARRQCHETLVHRIDAELAAGSEVTATGDGAAADGVDELLDFLPVRAARRLVADPARTLVVETDAGLWALHIGPEGPSRVPPPPGGPTVDDVVVGGPAGAVHRFLWNRGTSPSVEVAGDVDGLLARWSELARI